MRGTAALLDLLLFSLLVSASCLPLRLPPPSEEERVASSFGQHLLLALQSVTLDSLTPEAGGLGYKTVMGTLVEEGVLGKEEVGKELENALRELCGGRWSCTLRVEVLRPWGRTTLLELSTGEKGRRRVYSTLLHRTLPPPEVGRLEVRMELWSR